jgi:hypothetical protein
MSDHNISKRALLALPSISVWTARRFDQKLSDEVAKRHKADSVRLGRYNKCVIDVHDESYVAIAKIAGEARRWHDAHTSPWAQDGARIMATAMYPDYSQQMESFRMDFEHKVAKFMERYPELKTNAKRELKGAFREEDYPTVADLYGKFAFDVSYLPVPTGGDFRVEDMSIEHVEAIRAQLEFDVSGAIKHAERDRWRRLFGVVQHIATKLSVAPVRGQRKNGESGIFRDTLIENLREACDTLPKLALSENIEFDILVEEARTKLAGLDPKELRDNVTVRSEAARKAADIVRKMERYFTPQEAS